MIIEKRKKILLTQAGILHYSKAGIEAQIKHLEKCINEIKGGYKK